MKEINNTENIVTVFMSASN